MTNPSRHQTLITTGCLLWIFSFFGEVFKMQPYSTIGLLISPPMTIVGVFFWFKYYKATRGHFPKLSTVRDNTYFSFGRFKLKFDFMFRHIALVWTATILGWMGIILIVVLTFNRTEAFEATKAYCNQNPEVLLKTGPIKYYGVLVGGTISTHGSRGEADFYFTIVGTNGNFHAISDLTKQNGEWLVENFEFSE